ncbi:MAG TPA: succinate dehydrogenase assembly factor 2 [Rhizomicrobium sp.]|jgi:antitoxin CptB
MTGESPHVRRKRLRFRAARRGFKETDAIFGTFAETYLADLDEGDLDRFESLLNVPDQEIYDWLRGHAPVPLAHDTPVFHQLKAICYRQNPTWNV